MIKRLLQSKSKHGLMALSLLLTAPVVMVSNVKAAQEVTVQEEALFNSLRKFLFRTRSTALLNEKKWADWCNEWIDILDNLPTAVKAKYGSLKSDLAKVSRWKNAISIGSKLEKALAPYLKTMPEDITQRVIELGKEDMLKLIDASLKGISPNIPDTKLDIDFDFFDAE